MQKLLDIMKRLRDPNEGCPWDLEAEFCYYRALHD